ncbi:MAG: flagellar basal body P-ring formation chaperone FlgA [Micropepsaceae bacterium]
MKLAAFAFAVLAAFAPASALTLEEALLDHLIAKGAPEDGAVALVGRVPRGLDGDTLDVAKIEYSESTGRFVVQARLASGRLYGLQGKVEDGMDVPVLTRAMKSGEVVSGDDVQFVRMAASRVPRGSVSDADKLVGFSAKRQLRAGIPLRESDVQKPLVIRKGDAVTMVFRAPGIELTSRGRAMTDGGVGDTVAVVNAQSLKQIDAVVLGAGTVNVSRSIAAVN